jgi:hypothetical protein
MRLSTLCGLHRDTEQFQCHLLPVRNLTFLNQIKMLSSNGRCARSTCSMFNIKMFTATSPYLYAPCLKTTFSYSITKMFLRHIFYSVPWQRCSLGTCSMFQDNLSQFQDKDILLPHVPCSLTTFSLFHNNVPQSYDRCS